MKGKIKGVIALGVCGAICVGLTAVMDSENAVPFSIVDLMLVTVVLALCAGGR